MDLFRVEKEAIAPRRRLRLPLPILAMLINCQTWESEGVIVVNCKDQEDARTVCRFTFVAFVRAVARLQKPPRKITFRYPGGQFVLPLQDPTPPHLRNTTVQRHNRRRNRRLTNL